MKDAITFSQAFHDLLNQLSVNEFPSGNGPWRNELRYRSDEFAVKTFQDDANTYSVDSLLELNEKVPFQRDTEWTKNCEEILEKSTKNPQDIDFKNIHKYFKKLRMVDKNVNEIDDEIHKFQYLEELVLSANRITSVSGRLLPRSLKVLELCGNELSDIGNLCCNCPPLNHLGLSHNSILSIEEYIKPNIWENLLSLDLCYNYISNLKETVSTLALLPKLRNLLLKGNPVFFFVGYHGYVIDSLKSLSILDDKQISADDRYYYKGFSKIKDLPINQFMIDISIDKLKGLIRIDEQDSLVDEYPRKITKYHVEFDFISDFSVKDDNYFETANSSGPESAENVEVTITTKIVPALSEGDCKNTVATNEVAVGEEEELSIDFHKLLLSNKTTEFRNYLKQRIKLRIIANQILLNNEPKPDEGKANTLAAEPPAGVGKEKSNKSVGRERSKTSVVKMGSNESGKSKPKSRGKQENAELFEWSRQKMVYATGEIDCKSFLDNTSPIEKEVVFEISPEVITNIKSNEGTIQEENSAKKLLDTKKKGNMRRISSSRSIMSTKTKPRKIVDPAASDASRVSNISSVPSPLIAHVAIKLLRWDSAKKAFEQAKHLANSNDVAV